MKTAMQQAIALVKKYENRLIPMGVLSYNLELLLEKEKEQISKAWDDGDYAYFYNKETGRDFENGEEYYNQTYNN